MADRTKNRRPITIQEKNAIRRYLKMGSNQTFPRCRRRDIRKAKSLDRELGFKEEEIEAGIGKHTRDRHVCAECRCGRVAGSGSWGWWYWPSEEGHTTWDGHKIDNEGFGEVGHYGAGPCWRHGQGNKRNLAIPLEVEVAQDIESMQMVGAAPDNNGVMVLATANADVQAVNISEMREATLLAIDTIRGIKEQLEGEGLTEKGGLAGAMPITDKSRFELNLKAAKTLSDLSKNEFLVAQDKYVHESEMYLLVKRIIEMTDRFLTDGLDKKQWTNELKQILMQVRKGKV